MARGGRVDGTPFAFADFAGADVLDDAASPIVHQSESNGCPHMSPQPPEGSGELGPCPSRLHPRPAEAPGILDPGHQMLRHFSHRCRNSLSGIKLGLYLLKKEAEGPLPSCWNELARLYDDIEQLFDRLQRIYQSETLTMVRSPLGNLIIERLPLWRSRYGKSGRTILIDPPAQDLAGDFDPMHFGLGLDAFVAWRAECGDSIQPRLGWRVAGDCFEICWQETRAAAAGPDERATGFVRSQLPDPTQSLALLLLARVAASHGGELETRNDPALGITIRWPQFRQKA
jgi:hypothetical protein